MLSVPSRNPSIANGNFLNARHKSQDISFSCQSEIPFLRLFPKSQLALKSSSILSHKKTHNRQCEGCASVECRPNNSEMGHHAISRGHCATDPSYQWGGSSLLPSPGWSTLKSTVAEFIRRERYLPTISFLYIIKIGQFANALYPFHIVR